MRSLYNDFPGFDRFAYPEGMIRVTAGMGGEAILILGERKTALYDTGMAYCAEGTIQNIRKALSEHRMNGLDYILLSHSHYDHAGALPYLLDAFPEALACGSEKCRQVFSREGAVRMMTRLSEKARDALGDPSVPIDLTGLRVDRVLREGDVLDLGGTQITVYETRGHTDCCLSFFLEPQRILITSESTGLLRGPGELHTAILKSFQDSMESAAKCRSLDPAMIISPHYGMVPDHLTGSYFDQFEQSARNEWDFILSCKQKEMSEEEAVSAFEARYWFPERAKTQPKAAFMENAAITVHLAYQSF